MKNNFINKMNNNINKIMKNINNKTNQILYNKKNIFM